MGLNTGIAVGLGKGYPLKKIEKKKREFKKVNNKKKFVVDLITEVAGYAPYERRIMELLKIGKEKRALKVAKKKLGTHSRGKKKREQMASVLRKVKFT